MWFLISKILHVIGNVLWLGGGAVVAFAFVMMANESVEVQRRSAIVLRRLTTYVVTPGMILSLVGGLVMLIGFWNELYKKAPWAHTKLTIGILAAAFSGVLTGRLRRAAAGQAVTAGPVRTAGIVLLVSAIAGVVAVFTKFGQ
ncbi:MAG TPA: CopD family protein [Polyangiales bacterium]